MLPHHAPEDAVGQLIHLPTVTPAAEVDDYQVDTAGPSTPSTAVEVAGPVLDAEVDDAPRSTVVAAPVDVPLSPRQAGALRYAGSVLVNGTRRTPVVLWDRAWDALRHADLREGNTHQGPVAERHAAEYGRRVAARKATAGRVLRATSAPWCRWQARIGRVPVPVPVWGVTAGSLAAVAYPDALWTAPFRLLNGLIGDLVGAAGAVVGHVAEAALPVAGPAALVGALGYGVTAEHRRRQAMARTAPPEATLTPTQVEAGEHGDHLTSAFIAAGIIRSDQRIELSGIPYQVAGGVCAPIRLPRGCYTGMIRQADKLTRLASVLDTTPQHLSVTDGDTARECSLTVYKVLPFTGAPVAHPLLGGGRVDVLREGVPAGQDVNGDLVRLDIKAGRHGLIVSSSGNGKSQHIMSLMISLATDHTSSFVLLDGKPDGALDPVRPLIGRYVDALQTGYLEAAAELLESELTEMRDRQRRIRAGQTVGWRCVILDEFQMFTGNPGAGDLKKDSPCQRIRAALVEISRLGRSTNVGLVLATQSYDGNTIDEAVLNNIGWRLIGFAPSKMSRGALGEHAERYGLDSSKMLVDTVQTGSAIMIAPNVSRYVVARGWYQDKAAVAAAVQRLMEGRGQSAPATPLRPVVEVPELLAVLVDHLDQLAVDGDDRAEIPSAELYEAVRERGVLHDGELVTATRMGTLLTAWGVGRSRAGRGAPVARSVVDIRAVARRIESGGPLVVAEGDD